MSRFNDWTNAENGLGRFAGKYIELDVRCQKGKTDKYYGIEIKKLINAFSKSRQIKGSYTERVLIISTSLYPDWKEFILQESNKSKQ